VSGLQVVAGVTLSSSWLGTSEAWWMGGVGNIGSVRFSQTTHGWTYYWWTQSQARHGKPGAHSQPGWCGQVFVSLEEAVLHARVAHPLV